MSQIFKQRASLLITPRIARKLERELRQRIFTVDVANVAFEVVYEDERAEVVLEGEADAMNWARFVYQVYGLFAVPDYQEFDFGATTWG
ncbi:MAG: hypothetical protein J0M33_19855 [Anaerolineae bacterium]|nr:hypothetical protein [Anaerolineae bacterium]